MLLGYPRGYKYYANARVLRYTYVAYVMKLIRFLEIQVLWNVIALLTSKYVLYFNETVFLGRFGATS
jgi:hypothetical protein